MTAALEIQDLRKLYNNGFEALKGIDLSVQQGDFFALLGPNGAGKSTTIGILCSLVRKSSGRVSVFGHDIDQDFSAAKQCLGVVPQEFNFNMFEKVKDILVNQAGYYGLPKKVAEERVDVQLKKLGLWDKRDEASRNLSGGMKRRLMIARALVHEPKLLILDEPTAGVDIELRRSMWDFLRELNESGTTIILTTHYLEEAEQLCKNVAIIDQGKIAVNTSVKSLLQRLNKEVYLVDLSQPLAQTGKLNEYVVTQRDETTYEVEIEKGQSLNNLFKYFMQQSIEVVSMRNKANRLEELFLSMVSSAEQESGVKQ